jgi:hypothetical protein
MPYSRLWYFCCQSSHNLDQVSFVLDEVSFSQVVPPPLRFQCLLDALPLAPFSLVQSNQLLVRYIVNIKRRSTAIARYLAPWCGKTSAASGDDDLFGSTLVLQTDVPVHQIFTPKSFLTTRLRADEVQNLLVNTIFMSLYIPFRLCRVVAVFVRTLEVCPQTFV